VSEHRHFDGAMVERVLRRNRRAILKTHFDAAFSESWMENETGRLEPHISDLVESALKIYVLRHPLDVLASFKQFMDGIDPGVQNMRFIEFIEAPHWSGRTDRLGHWAEHVAGWTARDDVLTVRYEDVIAKTHETLNSLEAAFDEPATGRHPLLPPMVKSIAKSRLNRLTQLSPASTAIVADSKRFRRPNWRTELSAQDLERCEKRIGHLLNRFGYDLLCVPDPRKP
jgi:hypothetical protein